MKSLRDFFELIQRVNSDLSGRWGAQKPSPGSEAAGSGEGGAARGRRPSEASSAVTDEVVLLGVSA